MQQKTLVEERPIRVLVVGGAGYIGGSVTDFLIQRNISFSVYDSLLYEQHYLKPVDFIYGDIRDTKKLKDILPDYTHVIWLAAIVGDAACRVYPQLTKAVNQDTVEWLSQNYNGRIIFASTCSVYGQNDHEVNEESDLNPLSLYAETKAHAESFLINKNALIFRLGTVFGYSDTYSRLRMDLAVNYMTANAVLKGTLKIFGGSQWRPLMHVRNIAEAIVDNLQTAHVGIYNLATFNYQIKSLGEEIARITGCVAEYADEKFQDNRNYHVSTSKANSAGILKFEKVYTVADGVKQIYDLISSNRIKYAENDVYFNERHVTNLYHNGELI